MKIVQKWVISILAVLGVCALGAWPNADDHLWPDQFAKYGRVAPKYRQKHQLCPLEIGEKSNLNGCFWRCRIFNGNDFSMSREEAVNLYDQRIKEVENV